LEFPIVNTRLDFKELKRLVLLH